MIDRDTENTELRMVFYVLLCALGVSLAKFILWVR
jgi:hypothetical protein